MVKLFYSNDLYDYFRDYIKTNHGYSAEQITKDGTLNKFNGEMEKMKQFDGLRVKIKYAFSNDWVNGLREKVGRIKVNDKKQVCFLEGRRTKNAKLLDAGLHEGFFATIVPLKIESL